MNPSTSSFKLALTIIFISTVFSLWAAETVLSWYSHAINKSSQMDTGLLRYHPRLGWALNENWQGKHRHHDFNASYHINALGFRGSLPVALHQKTKPRVAIFGDSFTFGIGVNNADTYVEQLQKTHSQQQWLNLGIPGTSTDQQWLYWQMIDQQLRADHVMFAVYLGNDLLDNPLAFPLQAEQGKPFFKLHNQQLTLQNSPVPRHAKTASDRQLSIVSIAFGDALEQRSWVSKAVSNSAILQRLVPRQSPLPSEQLNAIMEARLVAQKRLQHALIKQIAQQAKKNQQRFTLLLLPGQSLVAHPQSVSAIYQEHVRRFMLAVAEQNNIAVIDASSALKQQFAQRSALLFHPNEGHFTAEGHRVVAETIAAAVAATDDSKQ